MAISVPSNRLRRSSLASLSSSTLRCNSLLTVCSSSLTDCASSREVSSSSLVDCSSSLIETSSSLADFSSSSAVSYSSTVDCSRSRVSRSSRSSCSFGGCWSSISAGSRRSGVERRADIAEHDQEQRLGVVIGQRLDRQIEELDAVVDLDLQPVAHDPAARLDRLAQRGAQVEPQPAPRHRDNIARRRAGRVFEIFAGAGREMHDLAVARHDDVRRRELLDDPALDDCRSGRPAWFLTASLVLDDRQPPAGQRQRQARDGRPT